VLVIMTGMKGKPIIVGSSPTKKPVEPNMGDGFRLETGRQKLSWEL